MQILIAPNSFRGSINALEVAQALAEGLQQVSPSFTIDVLPIADGGDYFATVLTQHFGGTLQVTQTVDPLGRPIEAHWGLVNGRAFVEVAQASGTHRLVTAELAPLEVSSYGTGMLMKAALEKGCKEMMLGLGGSATVDGGMGILHALGIRFLDARGNELSASGTATGNIATVDLQGLMPQVAECSITLVCDVENPLLGKEGAASVFGPQKGATKAQVAQLEQNLTHFANITQQVTGISVGRLPHGGAAGGIAAFLHAYLGAEMKPGTETVLDVLQFDRHLAQADLVITGEGKLDAQTLNGKGPHGIAQRAKQKGKKVIGVAGAIPRENLSAFSDFDALVSICDRPMPLEEAMQYAPELLRNTGYRLGQWVMLLR